MDFGKLTDISGVDFSLPASDTFYFTGNEKNAPELLIGATGWSMPEWKGNIYPLKTPSERMGTEYSRQFATIEFNTTYYQIPPAERMQKWKEMTTPDFVFCPKMYQGISQSRAIGLGNSILPDFLHRMTLFEEKLGLIFMQMPQFSSGQNKNALFKFIEQWGTGIPLAIELRHPDYFEKELAQEVATRMAAKNISWLITDVSGRRDVSHSYITAPYVVIRFVGTSEIDSNRERISSWLRRINEWGSKGVQTVYFFIHTPGNLTPHHYTNQIASEWQLLTGQKIKVPHVPESLFPE
jgi:uncharacterized protein YecE (DUF72 family)